MSIYLKTDALQMYTKAVKSLRIQIANLLHQDLGLHPDTLHLIST